MSADLWEPIIGIGTVIIVILTLVLVIGKKECVRYLRTISRWIRKRITTSRSPTTLNIPQPPPVYASAFPAPAIPLNALHGKLAKHIMGNGRKLLAFRTPRNTYLVEYHRPGELVKSIETPNAEAANMQWREWFLDWKGQPAAFGGSSGTGLNGDLPF